MGKITPSMVLGHLYEGLHSNFKELKNLVNAVSEAAEDGLLVDTELFLFTDNVVAERAYYMGVLIGTKCWMSWFFACGIYK